MRISSLSLATAIGLSLAHVAAQPSEDKTLAGTVTIKSKGATIAVHGKSTDIAVGHFLFCVDRERSTATQPIDFTGPARVVYRRLPPPQVPAGVVMSGPENVAATLAVVAEDGRAWLFVGEGQKPILRAGDPALAKATTANVRLVRRTDWSAARGPRRGTDIEGCLAPGG